MELEGRELLAHRQRISAGNVEVVVTGKMNAESTANSSQEEIEEEASQVKGGEAGQGRAEDTAGEETDQEGGAEVGVDPMTTEDRKSSKKVDASSAK